MADGLMRAVNCWRNLFDAWRWKELPDEWRNRLMRYRRAGQWQLWRTDTRKGGWWEYASDDNVPSYSCVYRLDPKLRSSYCDNAQWKCPETVALELLRPPYQWPVGSLPLIPETEGSGSHRYSAAAAALAGAGLGTTIMFREEMMEAYKEMTMAQVSDKSAILVVETRTFVNGVDVKTISATEQVELVMEQHRVLANRKAAAETMDLKALEKEIAAREKGIKDFQAAANAIAPA